MRTHTSITDLSDDALIARTKSLIQNERSATAVLVQHLAEMDARRLHVAEGYSSLFRYCMEELHLSEFATYTRIAAARAGRKFPIVFELLENGDLHLSAVDVLTPHLTEENHRELLARARHRSKREVEKIVAEIAPKPPVVATVRRLPVRIETTSSVPDSNENAYSGGIAKAIPSTLLEPPPTPPVPDPARRSSPKRGSPSRVEPLSPEHYKIQFTADPATVELLKRAQDILRHQIPNGDPAAIFAMALRDLVLKLEKRKAAEVARPRTMEPESADAPSTLNTRHIPAAVRRIAWRRDQGRCAFHSRDGRRCSETGHLEFHHVKPFAHGGRATAANIEIRCRAHNGYEAVREFGERSASMVREKEATYWSRDQLAGQGRYTIFRDSCRPRASRRTKNTPGRIRVPDVLRTSHVRWCRPAARCPSSMMAT